MAVNPQAPRQLPTTRAVGESATQNAAVQTRVAEVRSLRATDIRVNQQQVNAAGERVGINRPDVQYTLNGVRYNEEFETSVSTRGPAHVERILLNDPAGQARFWTID